MKNAGSVGGLHHPFFISDLFLFSLKIATLSKRSKVRTEMQLPQKIITIEIETLKYIHVLLEKKTNRKHIFLSAYCIFAFQCCIKLHNNVKYKFLILFFLPCT